MNLRTDSKAQRSKAHGPWPEVQVPDLQKLYSSQQLGYVYKGSLTDQGFVDG